MIEITNGTIEERIIKILQKTYPITVSEVKAKLNISRENVMRVLQKFQVKGIIQLEPLPNKIYIRLIRHDFKFVGKKRQKKFIKHHSGVKKQESKEYNGMMYS
jgi:predicted transcriptional regulator